MGRQAIPGRARDRAPGHPGAGRHPLGGAELPGPGGAAHRLESRCSDPGDLHGTPRTARELAGVGAAGKLHATTVALEPLSSDEVAHLVENFLAGGVLDVALRGRIDEAAGGNPLFIEETLAMLVDDDLLTAGGWAVGRARRSRPVRRSSDDPGTPDSTAGWSGRSRSSADGSCIDHRSLVLPWGAARADTGARTGEVRVASASSCGAT